MFDPASIDPEDLMSPVTSNAACGALDDPIETLEFLIKFTLLPSNTQ